MEAVMEKKNEGKAAETRLDAEAMNQALSVQENQVGSANLVLSMSVFKQGKSVFISWTLPFNFPVGEKDAIYLFEIKDASKTDSKAYFKSWPIKSSGGTIDTEVAWNDGMFASYYAFSCSINNNISVMTTK